MDKPLLQHLSEYYVKCDLWLPNFSSMRQFKLRLWNNHVIQIHNRIGTKDKLRKWLVRHTPIDAWYTNTYWLDPLNLTAKKKNGHVKDVLIGGQLVFDIDGDYSLQGISDARSRVVDLLEFLDARDIDVNYILFSGKKGFQITCNYDTELPSNYHLRETTYIENRKDLIKELPKHIIPKDCDRQVTIDSRRVIRLPMSGRDNGYVATFITREMLKLPIEQLVQQFRYYTPTRPVIPTFKEGGGEMKEGGENALSLVVYRERVMGLAGQRPVPTLLLTNECKSRRVIMLRYGKKQRYIEHVRRLQTDYRIGSVVIFETLYDIWVIGISAFEVGQLKKIYRVSKALNRQKFGKYGKVFLPLVPDFDKSSVQVRYVLRANEPRQPYSLAISELLNMYDVSLFPTTEAIDTPFYTRNYVGGHDD